MRHARRSTAASPINYINLTSKPLVKGPECFHEFPTKSHVHDSSKKNLPCDEDGEGCSCSATVEGGTVTTTNCGRHRQDNDGNLFRLHIISDASVTDRQVTVSRSMRNRKLSQKGKETDEEVGKHSQKEKETDEQDTDREKEVVEQDRTHPPVTKRNRGHKSYPHGREKFRFLECNGVGVCPHGRHKYH